VDLTHEGRHLTAFSNASLEQGDGYGPERVLVVDDEAAVRRYLARVVTSRGYDVLACENADDALVSAESGEFGVVLADLRMPGHDGLWLLDHIVPRIVDLPVIMVTGNADARTAIDCLTRGAANYIMKPVDPDELAQVIGVALENRRLRIENRSYRQDLERLVAERTGQLRDALTALEGTKSALEQAYRETVYRLAAAAEYRDEETGNHILRIGMYSQVIARHMGCAEEFCSQLLLASPMHDVGKIGIRDCILLKPGKLTAIEFEEIKTHALIGGRLLSGSTSPLLQLAEVIALSHHERFDGQGYPRGLAGHDIPLPGRVVALADVFDALTSKRVYKPAYPLKESIEIVRQERGSHFDPDVVDAFLGAFDEIMMARSMYADIEQLEFALEGVFPVPRVAKALAELEIRAAAL
jgi:putative two-component system response regulator